MARRSTREMYTSASRHTGDYESVALEGSVARSRWLRALQQPLEPRVAPQRREVGVDLEPAGREIARDLEQRLEVVERLLGLAHHEVDAGELVLDVRSDVGVAADRKERHGVLTFLDRGRFAPQVGIEKTEERVELRIVRGGLQFFLIRREAGIS